MPIAALNFTPARGAAPCCTASRSHPSKPRGVTACVQKKQKNEGLYFDYEAVDPDAVKEIPLEKEMAQEEFAWARRARSASRHHLQRRQGGFADSASRNNYKDSRHPNQDSKRSSSPASKPSPRMAPLMQAAPSAKDAMQGAAPVAPDPTQAGQGSSIPTKAARAFSPLPAISTDRLEPAAEPTASSNTPSPSLSSAAAAAAAPDGETKAALPAAAGMAGGAAEAGSQAGAPSTQLGTAGGPGPAMSSRKAALMQRMQAAAPPVPPQPQPQPPAATLEPPPGRRGGSSSPAATSAAAAPPLPLVSPVIPAGQEAVQGGAVAATVATAAAVAVAAGAAGAAGSLSALGSQASSSQESPLPLTEQPSSSSVLTEAYPSPGAGSSAPPAPLPLPPAGEKLAKALQASGVGLDAEELAVLQELEQLLEQAQAGEALEGSLEAVEGSGDVEAAGQEGEGREGEGGGVAGEESEAVSDAIAQAEQRAVAALGQGTTELLGLQALLQELAQLSASSRQGAGAQGQAAQDRAGGGGVAAGTAQQGVQGLGQRGGQQVEVLGEEALEEVEGGEGEEMSEEEVMAMLRGSNPALAALLSEESGLEGPGEVEALLQAMDSLSLLGLGGEASSPPHRPALTSGGPEGGSDQEVPGASLQRQGQEGQEQGQQQQEGQDQGLERALGLDELDPLSALTEAELAELTRSDPGLLKLLNEFDPRLSGEGAEGEGEDDVDEEEEGEEEEGEDGDELGEDGMGLADLLSAIDEDPEIPVEDRDRAKYALKGLFNELGAKAVASDAEESRQSEVAQAAPVTFVRPPTTTSRNEASEEPPRLLAKPQAKSS